MPYSIEDQAHVLVRLGRLSMQAETLEHSILDGVDNAAILQGLAEMRSMLNLLEAETLEVHLLDLFGHGRCSFESVVQNDPEHERVHVAIDEMVALVGYYLL